MSDTPPEANAFEERVKTLEVQSARLTEERDEAAAQSASLQERVGELEAQVATLTTERDEAKTAASAARKQARAAKAALPAKPRKLGRINGSRLAPAELRALIDDAETVELVFSDGRTELRDLAPRTIEGPDAWRDNPNGLKLNVPELTVHGPGAGVAGGSYSLAGYALLVDGEQVAWMERPDGPLTIGTGGTFDLKDDVIF